MAESSSSDAQAAGQHYLACGTEYCKENGQFYCNDCYQTICEQCRDKHLKGSDTKTHEIVLYQHRKHKLPVEKCKLHPKRNIDMFCKECKIPLCSECSTVEKHHGHKFDNFEKIYAKCEFSKIQKCFLPTSQGLKKYVKGDVKEAINLMKRIRTSQPVFPAGYINKDDVAILLGRGNVPNTDPEKRNIQPTETVATNMKLTEKQVKKSKENSDTKRTLSLSSSVTKIREYSVPDVVNAFHVSVEKSGKLWVSDNIGDLVKTNLQGFLLRERYFIGCRPEGYHTVAQDGDLIYALKCAKLICRITPKSEFADLSFKTGDWAPMSLHCSHINGDTLVGMKNDKDAKISRYNNAEKEIQSIQFDNKGENLYSSPSYITENINGDICTSDYDNEAVVVVNRNGLHRFSYTGQGSGFCPFGICTNVLGHILVCDGINNTVNVLDQDGGFLSCLLSQKEGIERPRGLCVDDENNLYVGQYGTNIVTVYKYLQ